MVRARARGRARRGLAALAALAAATGAAAGGAAGGVAAREQVARAAAAARAVLGLRQDRPLRFERVALSRLARIVAAERASVLSGPAGGPVSRALERLGLLPGGSLEELLRAELRRIPPAWYHPARDTVAIAPAPASSPEAWPVVVRAVARALAARAVPEPAGAEPDSRWARSAVLDGAAALACHREGGETRRCLGPEFGRAPVLLRALDGLTRAAFERLRDRFEAGGPAAVARYLGRPPATAARVLHPDDAPPGGPPPNALSAGELGLRAWLAPVAPGEEAERLAAGWEWDRLDFAGPEEIVWRTRWRSGSAAARFAGAAERRLRVAGGGDWRLQRRGREVSIVLEGRAVPAEPLGDDPWEGVRFGYGREEER
ncbi:MAG: hypothetical protein D6718_09855 [Acidobacteria bacterium]|nr:MAG: hypothetical protein D6718_09855 [Acidobacteriota bacterium]